MQIYICLDFLVQFISVLVDELQNKKNQEIIFLVMLYFPATKDIEFRLSIMYILVPAGGLWFTEKRRYRDIIPL